VPDLARVALPSSRNAVRLFIRADVTVQLFREQTHRELVNRPFQFQKRGQHFIGTHDETLSVAMRVSNPDRVAVRVQC